MSKSVAAGGAQVDGFIGDIVTSILTEAQFQSQRNSGWVLMDGRSVGGSKYATTTGNSVIPDARGMFLRGKNNGRADGKQNPDGDVAMGTYQADSNKAHTHIQDSHNHTQNDHTHNNGVTQAGNPSTNDKQAYTPYQVTATTPNAGWVSWAGNFRGYTSNSATGTLGIASNIATTATNQSDGGNETRSRNITVNYFIKIN